jgi:O-antigen/teichoic acid export membrane protein
MQPSRLEVWTARAQRVAFGGAANVVGALGGAVRNKILATALQTTGMGMIAQVQTSQVWLGLAASLGLSIPVTQCIGAAIARDDEPEVRRVVWTALTASGAAIAVTIAAGLLLERQWTEMLLGPGADPWLVRLSLITVAGLAIQAIVQGVFAGRSDVRAPLTLAILGNLVVIAAAATLVGPFGLRGAVVAIAAFIPFGLAGTLAIHRREYRSSFLPVPHPRFHAATARTMLKVAVAALTMSLLDQGTLLAVRTHFARTEGFSANGLLQAAFALTQQTGAVFYAYLGSYAFGKISGAKGPEGIRAYVQRQWSALMMLAALSCAAVMLLSRPLIHLAFSSRFDGAQPMMSWMLFGEYARVGMQCWIFGALPLGGLRLYVPLGLSYTLGIAGGYGVALALGLGSMSVAFAYAFAGCLALAVSAVVMTWCRVPLTPRGWLVLLAGLAGLATLAWLQTR